MGLLNSVAGTGTKYVAIQGRMRDGLLHIQGKGPEVNRDYGVAVEVKVPDKLAKWIGQRSHSLKSLAGGEAKYVPMQATVKGETTHIQVEGAPGLNRVGYTAFDVEGAGPLHTFIGRVYGDALEDEGTVDLGTEDTEDQTPIFAVVDEEEEDQE